MSDHQRSTPAYMRESLDEYNKRYLLSDAEQDVIKKAIIFITDLPKGTDKEDCDCETCELIKSVKNYEEIKNKLR